MGASQEMGTLLVGLEQCPPGLTSASAALSSRGSLVPAAAAPGHRPRLLVPGLQLVTRAVVGGTHLLAEP